MENANNAAYPIIPRKEDHTPNEILENMEKNKIVEKGDDEDEKIDEFFELVRSFREVRDRRRNQMINELATNINNINNKKRKCIGGVDHHNHEEEDSGSWVPRFELQDFMQPSFNANIKCVNGVFVYNEDDVESGLDLKLSL